MYSQPLPITWDVYLADARSTQLRGYFKPIRLESFNLAGITDLAGRTKYIYKLILNLNTLLNTFQNLDNLLHQESRISPNSVDQAQLRYPCM